MINRKYNDLLMNMANFMMTKNVQVSELNKEIERLKKLLERAERKETNE